MTERDPAFATPINLTFKDYALLTTTALSLAAGAYLWRKATLTNAVAKSDQKIEELEKKYEDQEFLNKIGAFIDQQFEGYKGAFQILEGANDQNQALTLEQFNSWAGSIERVSSADPAQFISSDKRRPYQTCTTCRYAAGKNKSVA